MQRNKLFVLSFLISLSVICQAQNFGWYESSQQLFGLQDYQPILNRISYLNLDSIDDIRGFRSITQYQNLQLSQNIYQNPDPDYFTKVVLYFYTTIQLTKVL